MSYPEVNKVLVEAIQPYDLPTVEMEELTDDDDGGQVAMATHFTGWGIVV